MLTCPSYSSHGHFARTAEEDKCLKVVLKPGMKGDDVTSGHADDAMHKFADV